LFISSPSLILPLPLGGGGKEKNSSFSLRGEEKTPSSSLREEKRKEEKNLPFL